MHDSEVSGRGWREAWVDRDRGGVVGTIDGGGGE